MSPSADPDRPTPCFRPTFLVCVVLSSIVLLGACGDDATSPAAPATPTESSTTVVTTPPPTTTSTVVASSLDPCALLTVDEVTALAGTPLEPGIASPPDDPTYCQYRGPTSGPTAQVDVFVGDGVVKALDVNRDLGHELTTLPGLGDEAYEEEYSVYVRVDTTWIQIRLVRLEDYAMFRDQMRAAAGLVAQRLTS